MVPSSKEQNFRITARQRVSTNDGRAYTKFSTRLQALSVVLLLVLGAERGKYTND